MKPKDDAAYEVGFGKPPRHGQFKKGQSGNPNGRPKGSLNRALVIARILAEQITITENGQKRTITKFEAAVKQVVHKAIGGDPRAMDQVMRMSQMLDGDPGEGGPSRVLSEADLAVMASLAKRIQAQPPAPNHGEGDE